MPYCDDFWHVDAHENIAYLFDSLCKIENWEPAYQICYCLLSSRQQRKMWNSCCNETTDRSSDFITPDLWPPNSPDLNTVDYRIILQYLTCLSQICLKLNADELKRLLIEAWLGIQQSVADQAIDQWRVLLNACVKAKGKRYENMLWCGVPQMSIICYELTFSYFLFHNF